MNNSLDL